MQRDEWMNKPLPPIPPEIAAALEEGAITAVPFAEKNRILREPELRNEVGYRRLEDGNWLVSMVCPMPNVTPEMIRWWFWWHPQADERYQAWFPREHYGISYAKKDRPYFRQSTCPAFQNNTQYPTERIGAMKMPLRIDFVTPEEFGFSGELMAENHIPLIVCGHVGAFRGLIWHTEMAHIFQQTDHGLMLYSRFWIGQTLKMGLLRRQILTEDTAGGMAEHCCVEYRNLAALLPEVYTKMHGAASEAD